jgi:SAM-dependent methyltransferase
MEKLSLTRKFTPAYDAVSFKMAGKNLLLFTFSIFVFFLFLIPEAKAQQLDVPYVPTPENVVEQMLDVVNVGPGDYVIDLGSGDGRIVIAAAKRGAVGHGIDIDPKRIREANENKVNKGVEGKVMFLEGDLFEADFSRASVVTMYLLNSVNLKLRPYLLKNLRPGTRIVSHDFDMADWEPDKQLKEGYSDIYYWVIPANAEGNWKWRTDGDGFTMSVKQNFQQIEVNAKSGNTNLKIHDPVLSGERIGFTATNPSNGHEYVFNGRIDGSNITGTVQVRRKLKSVLENWDANRN